MTRETNHSGLVTCQAKQTKECALCVYIGENRHSLRDVQACVFRPTLRLGMAPRMCRSRDSRETNDISTTNHVTVPWRYSCAVMVPGRDFDSGSTTSVLVPTVRGCSMTSCSFGQTET